MADGDPVNIPIESSFNGAGFDAAAQAGVSLGARLKELQTQEQAASAPIAPTVQPLKGAEEVEGKLRELQEGAREFLDTLKLGVGINVGEKLVEGIGEVYSKFKEAVVAGVEFNSEVEGSINSFASTLQSVQPALYATRDAAKGAAADVFGQVRSYAIQNGLDVKTTFEALSANYNAFVEAGATDTTKQIQFVSTILSAEASKGIDGQRALRDSIDLLQGRFNNLVFAKEIGVTADEFKRAAENGNQLDYILSHLTGYAAGINDNANSFKGLSTSVSELVHQLEGSTFAPVFSELTDGLRELKTELQDPAVADGLRQIGFETAEVVHSGAALLEFALKNAGALATLAEGGVAVGAAFAALKISNLVAGLASLLSTAVPAATAVEGVAGAVVAVEGAAVPATAAAGGLGVALAGVGAAPVVLGLAAIGAAIVKISADIDAASAKSLELGQGFTRSNESNGRLLADASGTPEQFDAARKRLLDQLAQLQKTIDENSPTLDTGGEPGTEGSVDISSDAQKAARDQAEQMLQLTQNRLAELDKIKSGELDVSNIKKDQIQQEKALSDAEKEALANIGAELDKNNLSDTDKATQAAAYQSALDEAIRKTAEQTGLSADVVANIKSSADFQEAANGLSEKQQAILAGNLTTIIAARNAYDKANDALQKQNDQLAKQSDTLKDNLGDINEKLTDQYAKLEKVKASTDTNKPAEIQRIESTINALLDDQEKKRAALAKVTQQQADNADPAAAARVAAARKVLDQPLPESQTPEQEQARADARAQAQATVNSGGKTPGQPAVDLADPNYTGTRPPQANDLADPANQSPQFPTEPNDLQDPDKTEDPTLPNDLGGNPAASTGPASVPYTGPQPPTPTAGPGSDSTDPEDVIGDATAQQGTNTALADANTNLGQAAQATQQTATNTQQQSQAVQTALSQSQQADTDYHNTLMDGIGGISDNVSALMQALLLQNQTITSQAQDIAQLQLQVQNIADTANS